MIWVPAFLFAVLATCANIDLPASHSQVFPNANHIFNAIHDSARQFDSLLRRVGMSLFVATVPEGTELYHGTSWPYRINDSEWLSFEPEHALLFARPGMPPPFNRSNPLSIDHSLARLEATNDKSHFLDFEDPIKGHFHTYKAKRALNLLYIDGSSAISWLTGTNDVQDCVLMYGHKLHRNDNIPSSQPQPGSQRPLLNEDVSSFSTASSHHGESAATPDHGKLGSEECYAWGNGEFIIHMCDVAENQWQGRIDGFMRMEGGFEIIFCDFQKNLDLQSIKTSRGRSWDGDLSDSFSMAQTIASRYHGIGGGRVRLDYSDFLTMYTYPEVMFRDGEGRPRINGSADLLPVKKAVDEMVLRDHIATRNWQEVADMVVARYSDRLQILSDPKLFVNHDMFLREADRAIHPFIDYADRNDTEEISRCAVQFFPTLSEQETLTVAYKAILNVTATICESMLVTTRSKDMADGIESINRLKEWLAWTSFKGCRGCAPNELCWVPVWAKEEFPVQSSDVVSAGNTVDRPWNEPTCLSGEAIMDRDRYVLAPP